MTSKRKVILPIIVAAMLLCQACGDVLTPATPASVEDELTLLGEGQPSATSETETQREDYYYGDYKELSEGDRAPWFSAELVDGSTFEMADLQGKVILINFWATWCPPCVGEMPAFEDLYADYRDNDDVVIVAVDVEESKWAVDSFVDENGYTFPIAYDTEGKIGLQYPTGGIPYTVIVGKDGTIKTIHLGANSAEKQYRIYKADIEAALAE